MKTQFCYAQKTISKIYHLPLVVSFILFLSGLLIIPNFTMADVSASDSGSAGSPNEASPFTITGSENIGGQSFSQAISTLNGQQKSELKRAVEQILALRWDKMQNLSNGTGKKYGVSQASGPANNKMTYFVDDEGLLYLLQHSAGGENGNLGSMENGGGVGWFEFRVCDEDGNVSKVMFHCGEGRFKYIEFERNQLVRAGREVIIRGELEVNEDSDYEWSAEIPDEALPKLPDCLAPPRWVEETKGDWKGSCVGGETDPPTADDKNAYRTRFLQPGTFKIAVTAEREFEFEILRPRANSAYTEGLPISMAFVGVPETKRDKARGKKEIEGVVHDITPPELHVVITTNGGRNHVDITEQAKDKRPVKDCQVEISGKGFLENLVQETLADGIVPSNGPVLINEAVSPSVYGLFFREDERIHIEWSASDNFTNDDWFKDSENTATWSIKNTTTNEMALPSGTVEYHVIRSSNVESGEGLILEMRLADEAGNETVMQLPLRVLPRDIGVSGLSYRNKRRRR